jgi:hypothetical protein
MTNKTTQIAHFTRLYRKIHRWVAVPLLVFMLLMGCTGLLLGWKKQTGLLPKTQQGANPDASKWLPLEALQAIAATYAVEVVHESPEIDRIDIRPAKAIAKIVFAHHFTELQIDCTTGKVLAVARRDSDIIEKIHDGSILDFVGQTGNDAAKLTYTTVVACGLILLSLSGFWLWYNPIRIKRIKNKP